ncbi:MAG: ATP-binding protein [Lachnospiraceae bacterium]|nr:ATP-binding protein [Lachnospiraceae bacterium]
MTKENIFSPSFGRKPTVLLGREQIIDDFAEGLKGPVGNRDRATLIMGQRGSGKTVLLLSMAEKAAELGFIIASPTVSGDGMSERILEKIEYEASRITSSKKKRISGGGIGVLGVSANLSFSQEEQSGHSFAYKLTRLSEKVNAMGRGILILVDEVQGNHPELRELAIAYQELVGAGLDVAIAMAGLPGAVSSVLNDKVLTFLHRAKKVSLPDLKTGEIDAFFLHAFETCGLTVSDTDRWRAAEAAEGSPYRMQLIGHYMTRYAGSDGRLTKSHLTKALQTAEADYKNGVCVAIAESLTDVERAFLASLSPEGNTPIREVAEAMHSAPDKVNNYRRRLLDAGIIISPRRGEVRCAIPLLVEYLREQG